MLNGQILGGVFEREADDFLSGGASKALSERNDDRPESERDRNNPRPVNGHCDPPIGPAAASQSPGGIS